MKQLTISLAFLLGAVGANAQMQWMPTEFRVSTGVWVAEGDMKDAVDGVALGAHVGWMTRTSNGWAGAFGGIEHGGFVGLHRIGASTYGWQPQLGWTLRTRQSRLIGWSFSTGLAYNSRIFDAENNSSLEAVGSHWNGLLGLGLTVANDSPLSLGIGILHTSNGALRRPNKGINTPHANLVWRIMDTPRRSVRASAAEPLGFRTSVGMLVGGRDHGAYGGHIYGVQELFVQSSMVWSTRFALSGQAAVVHHGALRADPLTDAPSDTLANDLMDRLQPGLSLGWSWLFGRARLDVLKGAVLVNPTPGFVHRYNKAQLFLAIHPDVDAFVALRFTDWRADYVGAGLALRLGMEDQCDCPRWGKVPHGFFGTVFR